MENNSNPSPTAINPKRSIWRSRFEWLSPELESAFKVGLLIQVIVGVLCALMLDGGQIARMYLMAWIGQLLLTMIVIVRRGKSPTKFDLMFVRSGIFLLLFLAIIFLSIFHPHYF